MSHQPTPLHAAALGFLALAFAVGVGRFALTPLLPVMQGEGLISISGGGMLASVHYVGYALGALAATSLRAPPRAVLAGSLALIGLTTLAMGVTDSHAVWLIARWVAGVTSALVLVVVSTAIVQRVADAGRGDLGGMVFAGVGGGIAVIGLAMLGVMAARLTSGTTWIALGLATLIVAGIIHASIGPSQAMASDRAYGARSLRIGTTWRILLPYGVMGAGYIIPATYLPVMAQQSATSPLIFGLGWPVFGLAALVSTLLSARLHRVWPNRRVWITGQVVMAAGLILPALWPHIAAIIIGAVCVGGTFMVVTMAGIMEAHRLAGPERAQSLVARLTAAFALGQIVGPVLAGWAFAASGDFTLPLLIGGIALVLSVLPLASQAKMSSKRV
jgi:predicted MFS family arabinose efflux permease